MNKAILMGRLTRDPDVRYQGAEDQSCVVRFSLAVDRKFKKEGEKDADFFNCVAFGKLGVFVERYIHQGTKILLTGRIQNDNYTNRQGERVYSVGIIAEEIEFAESRSASQGNGSAQQPAGEARETENNQRAGQYTDSQGFMNIPDGVNEDDLPFC